MNGWSVSFSFSFQECLFFCLYVCGGFFSAFPDDLAMNFTSYVTHVGVA